MKNLFFRWKLWQKIVMFALLGAISVLLLTVSSVLVVEFFAVRVPIFGFHNVYDPTILQERPTKPSQLGLEYPVKTMEQFLEHVAEKNYWTLTSQEIYDYFIAKTKQKIPPEHAAQIPIAITFDDGYKSIHTRLLPTLESIQKKYNRSLKVILFVNSGFLGKHGVFLEHMSCNDLRDGFKKGFYDVQSHTVNHKRLTTLSASVLAFELSQDQINLRRCIGELDQSHQVAHHVAYPFGADNSQVTRYAAKYFRSGFLYNGIVLRLGNINKKLGSNFSQYNIPRLSIAENMPIIQLKKIASGSGRFRSLFTQVTQIFSRVDRGTGFPKNAGSSKK